MKTTIKLISILMIVMMVTMVATPVFAAGEKTPSAAESAITGLDSAASSEKAPTQLTTLAAKILGFLRNASYIIGVIVLVVLGLKYMMGSLEEKAEYKKSLIPLVVGIIIVMGATTIATFLFDTFVI